MKKDGYKYLCELLDYLDTQSDEDNGKLFRAAVKYAIEGEFPQGLFPEAEHCFYTKVLPIIDNIGEGGQKGMRVENDIMDKSVREYPKFKFQPEWAYYIDKLDDWKRQLSMYDNISLYGCYGVEDEFLHADDEAYFDNKIRPELDRQHKLLDEGKDI